MILDANYSNQALRFFKQAERDVATRILKKIEHLRGEPFPADTKPVEGFREKLYRVRVGDFRILYEICYDKNILGIVKIDKRGRVY